MVVLAIGVVRFPAAWSDARRFDAPDDLLLAGAKNALSVMRVGWHEQAGGILRAKLSASCRSWGERVEVRIRSGLVECESRCVFGLVDWSKNKKNVTAFFRALDEALGAARGGTLLQSH